MDELLEQFLIEGRELVQQASDDLLALERNPNDAAGIDSAFRAVHTLKGSVGLFDLAPMGLALHAAEDLLDAMRNGQVTADRQTTDALLDCMSASDSWLESIARTEHLPADAKRRASLLAEALRGPLTRRHTELSAPERIEPDWLTALRAFGEGVAGRDVEGTLTAFRYTPLADCFLLGDDPLAIVRLVPDLVALRVTPNEPWPETNFDPIRCNLVIDALSAAPLDDVRRVFRFVKDQVTIVETSGVAAEAGDKSMAATAESGSRSLRIDAARIDAMGDIVGELIVAKNRLAHLVGKVGVIDAGLARELGANQSDIERLVGALHGAVAGARMVPLTQAFRRFPRLAREIAGELGKDVRFEAKGGETEADKAVVDSLFEPLMHLLRNALDHGIETAQVRKAGGKPAHGTITLGAQRRGDQIIADMTDDGAGIDPAKIRKIAKARGLMAEAALDALDDRAVLDLIFAPGFSTTTSITALSGRGVGMDVVRTTVERLGGRVTVSSTLGRGTSVSLSLPQAVALTTIVTIRVGEEHFGVPLDMVAETARIPHDQIRPIRDGAAFVLRDRTIPLLRLSQMLGFSARPEPTADSKVLIVAWGDQRIGLEVDGFAERINVLLRPMTGLLAGLPGVLGSTLLGDGRLLMILNVPELVG
jgi:two-component system chemotaxis sensor kinase CheA